MQTLKELIDEIPPELEPEIQHMVEFLMHKHGKTRDKKKQPKWLTSVKRGPSCGKSASATVETMREEERC